MNYLPNSSVTSDPELCMCMRFTGLAYYPSSMRLRVRLCLLCSFLHHSFTFPSQVQIFSYEPYFCTSSVHVLRLFYGWRYWAMKADCERKYRAQTV